MKKLIVVALLAASMNAGAASSTINQDTLTLYKVCSEGSGDSVLICGGLGMGFKMGYVLGRTTGEIQHVNIKTARDVYSELSACTSKVDSNQLMKAFVLKLEEDSELFKSTPEYVIGKVLLTFC